MQDFINIDRYLTDDMIHAALRASDSANEGGVVGGRERMMRAALEAAAPLIAAKALEAARGPYRCCPHCADDLIHDVEKDDHTVPCQLCQNDEIRQAKAEAWDEGRSMSELTWRHIYDGHGCAEGEMCPSCGQLNPYRADRIIQQAWNGPNVSASTGTHAAIVVHLLTDLSREDQP